MRNKAQNRKDVNRFIYKNVFLSKINRPEPVIEPT